MPVQQSNIAKDIAILQSGQYVSELMKSSVMSHRVSRLWLEDQVVMADGGLHGEEFGKGRCLRSSSF